VARTRPYRRGRFARRSGPSAVVGSLGIGLACAVGVVAAFTIPLWIPSSAGAAQVEQGTANGLQAAGGGRIDPPAPSQHRVVKPSYDGASTFDSPVPIKTPTVVGPGESGDPAAPDTSGERIYWGAWIDGAQYGLGNPPWDMRSVAAFEANTGKPVSIVHFGQPWSSHGVPQPFYPSPLDAVRQHGAIPLVDWSSWNLGSSGSQQPTFSLSRVIDGSFDAYITAWATGARDWGHPFFLRFDHEMNGSWFPWSESANGNAAGQFVQAWRHVHDLFVAAGANNVTWVWSPNVDYPGSAALATLYPGSSYVDWVAMDGYNAGLNPVKVDQWRSFSQIFGATYAELGRLAPGKPIMLAEVGSTEFGGSKAAWIANAFDDQLSTAFPDIRALVWFDWTADGEDWPIESSASASGAFAHAISSPYFAGNEFSQLSNSPIAPL
jgi:hypothetical protein